MWWRQQCDGACPIAFKLTMPQIIRDYFTIFDKIDIHNRVGQDRLDLEKTIEVKEWSFRLNSTILGMILVDSWYLFKHGIGHKNERQLSPHRFWCKIGTEMLQNHIIWKGNPQIFVIFFGLQIKPIWNWMTISFGRKGSPTKIRWQRGCITCHKKTTWVCLKCRNNMKQYYCYIKPKYWSSLFPNACPQLGESLEI